MRWKENSKGMQPGKRWAGELQADTYIEQVTTHDEKQNTPIIRYFLSMKKYNTTQKGKKSEIAFDHDIYIDDRNILKSWIKTQNGEWKK